MRLARAWRTWRALSAADWGRLGLAYLALGRLDLALRTLGFRRVAHHLATTRGAASRPAGPREIARARRYARLIDVAARHHLVRAHCLHRSLVLHAWLRHEGLPSEFLIGVRKEGSHLRAHAWVELAGQVVNDRPAAVAPFAPLGRGRGASVGGQAIERDLVGGMRWT
jgi:hypothetical protein